MGIFTRRPFLTFATGSAWTSVYLMRQDPVHAWASHCLLSIGIDPTYAPGQYIRIFGSAWNWRWAIRVNNPVVFTEAMKHPHMMPMYVAFVKLQSGLDGRYGWIKWRHR